jgi:bis(5'-nucleosyl)-tetraphosphatase (symmetrical)
VTVLGNHDLHLVCVAEGVEKAQARDTLDDVLERPIATSSSRGCASPADARGGRHGAGARGLLPEWTVAKARALAAEVEAALRGPTTARFLARMYGDEPDRWTRRLRGIDRLRVVINAMTRLRVSTTTARWSCATRASPAKRRTRGRPGSTCPAAAAATTRSCAGIGRRSGCAFATTCSRSTAAACGAARLTAVRLEDRKLFEVRCPRREGRED